MGYGLKYLLRFDSETGREYRIEISENGYEGDATQLRMGAAPVLRMDDGDAIRGTSLELTLEAQADGQLAGFYTTDNKKYAVKVLRDGTEIWRGFTLPELYSEPCTSPPYDVVVTAADGLGILKNVDYAQPTAERVTLMEVIVYCIGKTGVSLPYSIGNTLKRDEMSDYKQMLSHTDVNPEMFAGMDCYEVLEKVMTSLGAYITQRMGSWHIVRYTDLQERRDEANLFGTVTDYREPTVDTLGSTADDTYPLGGSLNAEIEPAKRSITMENKYEMRESFLSNHDFSNGLEGWYISGLVSERIWEDQHYVVMKPTAYTGSRSKLWQSVHLSYTMDPLSIEFDYAVCFAPMSTPPGGELGRSFELWITHDGPEKVRYLTRDGWQDKEGYIRVDATLQGGKVYGVGFGQFRYPENFDTFTINLDKLSWPGTLSVKVVNPYGVMNPDGDEVADKSNNNAVYIRNVRVMNNVEQNPDVELLLNEAASKDDEKLDICFVDAPFIENAALAFRNALGYAGDCTGNWRCAGLKGNDTFGYVALQSRAGVVGVPKLLLSGTIRATDADLLRDKYSGKVMYLREYSYDLMEEEMEVRLCECVGVLGASGLARRGTRVASTGSRRVVRSSGVGEHRVYNVEGSSQTSPKMIRDLASEPDLSEGMKVEVDDGLGSHSRQTTIGDIRALLEKRFWTREELQVAAGYLMHLGEKIKAGDSDLWSGKRFEDWLDQAVRRTDGVQFASVDAQDVSATAVAAETVTAEGVDATNVDAVTVEADAVRSDDFVAGMLGTGYELVKRGQNGKSYLEVDEIFARVKAVFAQLEVRKLMYSGGNFVFSPAGVTVTRVEERADVYWCFFTADDGETAVENPFRADDLVQMRTVNIRAGVHEGARNRYFWRRCVATGADYVELSKTDRDMTSDDAPAAGDVLVTVGNRTDKTRQHAIVVSVYGEGSPSIIQYAGIDGFSLEGKARIVISPERNRFTGEFVFSASGTDVETYVKSVESTANAAKQESAQARTDAEAAAGKAEAAGAAAGKAQDAADAAGSAAAEAAGEAEAAKGAADSAANKAASAQGAAEAAAGKAAAAQNAADAAGSAASKAQGAANAAQSAADKAQSDATAAAGKAEAAQGKADAAAQKAQAAEDAANGMTKTVTELTEKVSNFNLTVDGLKSTVSATTTKVETMNRTLNSTNETLEETKNKLEGMQIGVRNLLLESDVEQGRNAYTLGWYEYAKPLVPGKEYTVVCCYTLGANNTGVGFYSGAGWQNWEFRNKMPKAIGTWTFVFGSEPLEFNEARFYQFPNGTFGTKVHWAVLVEGNKAPRDWFPAPEDMQSEIDGMQVGARNLIKNRQSDTIVAGYGDTPAYSSFSHRMNQDGELEVTVTTLKAKDDKGRPSRYFWWEQLLSVPIVPDFYVFSFDYKTDCAGGWMYIDARTHDHKNKIATEDYVFENTGGAWRRGHILWDLRKFTIQDWFICSVCATDTEVGKSVTYRNLKLVRGNRGWDDSVAPEDTESKITSVTERTSRLEQTSEGITMEVGKVTERVTTVERDVETAAGKADDALKKAKEGRIYVRGVGGNQIPFGGRICIVNDSGENIAWGDRGLGLVILRRSDLARMESLNYDVNGESDAESVETQTSLAEKLNSLDSSVIVAIMSSDSVGRILWIQALADAIARCGGSGKAFMDRTPYAMVGIPGIGKGKGLEVSYGTKADAPFAEISVQVINGMIQGLNDVYGQIVQNLYGGTLMGDGVDLNELKAVGTYTFYTNSSVATMKNRPAEMVANEAKVVVTSMGSERYVRQELIAVHSSQTTMYERAWRDTFWTNWAQQENTKGTQAALDAAKADATSKTEQALSDAKGYTDGKTYRTTTIDARGLDEGKYYPVTIQLEAGRMHSFKLYRQLDKEKGVPSWSTHTSGFSVMCAWRSNGSGWGAIGVDGNRTVDIYDSAWTTVVPVGSIGQMGNSSKEYIYVRGGSMYYLQVDQGGGPVVLHETAYTEREQTVDILTEVVKPAPDFKTFKTETKSKFELTDNAIEANVSSINSVNDRVVKIESAGYITTEKGNELYASKTLEDGTEIVSRINQSAGEVKIEAKNIKLEGLVTANERFQVLEDGSIRAKNAYVEGEIHATSGEFTGKIYAKEGWIGSIFKGSDGSLSGNGLVLADDGIRSVNFSNANKTGTYYSTRGMSVYAGKGGILAPSTGFAQAARLVSKDAAGAIGLEVIADGTSSSEGVKITAKSSGSLAEIAGLTVDAYNSYSSPVNAPVAIKVVRGLTKLGGKLEVSGSAMLGGMSCKVHDKRGLKSVTITPDMSVVLLNQKDVSLYNGSGLQNGHIVRVVNMYGDHSFLYGDVLNGGNVGHKVHMRCSKTLVYYNGSFYAESDHN